MQQGYLFYRFYNKIKQTTSDIDTFAENILIAALFAFYFLAVVVLTAVRG